VKFDQTIDECLAIFNKRAPTYWIGYIQSLERSLNDIRCVTGAAEQRSVFDRVQGSLCSICRRYHAEVHHACE
jgi:hypothetical protein